MYASSNQVSKWIENKFPIFNNLIAVEKHRVVNYHFDIPSMSWKDFVAPLRALSPKALHCSGSWKMSPVLIQSGLGTMLGPPQHRVFSFWNITNYSASAMSWMFLLYLRWPPPRWSCLPRGWQPGMWRPPPSGRREFCLQCRRGYFSRHCQCQCHWNSEWHLASRGI